MNYSLSNVKLLQHKFVFSAKLDDCFAAFIASVQVLSGGVEGWSVPCTSLALSDWIHHLPRCSHVSQHLWIRR